MKTLLLLATTILGILAASAQPKSERYLLDDKLTIIAVPRNWKCGKHGDPACIGAVTAGDGNQFAISIAKQSRDDIAPGTTREAYASDLFETGFFKNVHEKSDLEQFKVEKHPGCYRTAVVTTSAGEALCGVMLIEMDKFIIFQTALHKLPVDKKRWEQGLIVMRSIRPVNAQQAGAEQPATAPESKPESEDEPKPDAEGRSR